MLFRTAFDVLTERRDRYTPIPAYLPGNRLSGFLRDTIPAVPPELVNIKTDSTHVLAYQYPTGVWINEGIEGWRFETNDQFAKSLSYGSARYKNIQAAIRPAMSAQEMALATKVYSYNVPGWRAITSLDYLLRDVQPFPWIVEDPRGTNAFGVMHYPATLTFITREQFAAMLQKDLIPRYGYLIKDETLGPWTSPAGRTYNVIRVTVRNQQTGQDMVFYSTVEGGGAGNFLDEHASTILRVVTDVGTFGQGELLHATNEDVAQKVDQIYGGGALAVVSAAVTGGASVAGTPIILAGAGGAISGGIAPDPSQAIVNSLVTGAVIGVGSAIASGPDTPYLPGGSSAPVPVTGGAPTDNPLISSTPDVNAPVTAEIPTPTTPVGTTPVGATPSTGVLSQTGATLSKAAATSIVGTGLTALTAEIKKLTGQVPATDNAPLLAANTGTPKPEEKIAGKTWLALGAAVVYGLSKVRHG